MYFENWIKKVIANKEVIENFFRVKNTTKKNKITSSEKNQRFKHGQATKGAKRMPWHQEPKKDAAICDKPRGVEKQTSIRGFPNGETRQSEALSAYGE